MATWPYTGKWAQIRIAVLNRDGWTCKTCGRRATTVNHVISWRTRPDLAWATSNLEAECTRCNYGRPSRQKLGLPEPVETPPQRDW